MASTFREVLFPPAISYGSSGGPKFKTTVFTADSGYEQRNRDWQRQRAEYDVSHGIKNADQMDELRAFFYAVAHGKAYGFRFKDWADFIIRLQVIGVGDGTTKTFQVVKTYTSGQAESSQSWSYTRQISKLAWGTLAGVTVAGVAQAAGSDYTVDENTGIITFANAPAGPVSDPDSGAVITPGAEIKIGYCEFHVPVRFDTDQLDATHDFWNTQSWPNIPLVEVRDWSEVAPT